MPEPIRTRQTEPGDAKVAEFRHVVLGLFLSVAFAASLLVLPAYYLIGIGPLTLACVAYSVVVGCTWWHYNRRGDRRSFHGQLFIAATLAVMLCGLATGDELTDNKPWQLLFPVVAIFIAGARAGALWSAAAWLLDAVVLTMRLPDYTPASIVIFLFAHAALSAGLYAFARSNEAHIRTISRLSHTDPLTGAYNRQLFGELFGNVAKRARRAQESLAVYMIDIDHFKRYNDSYGHVAGDRALVEVAAVLRQAARRASDLVFRYGGEEFCVVSSGITEGDARLIAEHVLEGVRALAIPHRHGEGGRLTVSIGLSFRARIDGQDIERYLLDADDALYRAKTAGRDCLELARTVPVGHEHVA